MSVQFNVPAQRRPIEDDEDGATAVEYGLLVAGIAALVVAIVFAFGGVIKTSLSQTCSTLGTKSGSARAASCSG